MMSPSPTALFLLTLLCSSFIAGCHRIVDTTPNTKGYCNELKSQMIFGGSTGNTRQSEIESSQAPLVQRNFDNKCMD